jgi:hypothetical protein
MLICTALENPTFIHQLFVIWTLSAQDFPIIFAARYDVVQWKTNAYFQSSRRWVA